MREGDVVIAYLPQSDGQNKPRPALVLRLMRPYGDPLVCGISTQLRQAVPGLDEVLNPDAENGLQATSLLRVGFLNVLSADRVRGVIGSIPDALRRELLQRLAEYLTQPTNRTNSGI